MKLRPVLPADIEIVLHHRREMFREMGGEYERLLDSFESASQRYFEAAIRDGSYFGLLGEEGGSIISGGGVVTARWPGSPLNLEPHRAWILNLYVEPAHRRKGYARVMTENLIDWCKYHGFQSVSLHASEYGRALYEQLGFRPTNEMRLKLAP